MFNNLQICTCHTFVTSDRRPIKLYEIGRGGQRPRGLGGLLMQIEKSTSFYDIVNPLAIVNHLQWRIRFHVCRSIRLKPETIAARTTGDYIKMQGE